MIRDQYLVGGRTPVADATVDWPQPRAAYIHIPFCRHRCGYCNFSVLAGRDQYATKFLSALDRELSNLSQRRTVDTIFIGGGTPTHLPVQWLEQLLEIVNRWFELTPRGEFSVEANPSDVEAAKLDALAAAGVNRISLGVQSFNSDKLHRLQRDHNEAIARQAIRHAADKIGNVSIDLIFAAPGEDLRGWDADVWMALDQPINHLSTYCLTFEKGTNFWSRLQRGELQTAPENLELAMYKLVIARCRAAGWQHYEVSNFSQPGRACRHNMAYWEGRGWYAAGPGAARFVAGVRSVNHRSPTRYMQRVLNDEDPIAEVDPLDREAWARERLVFGLRMLDGIDVLQIEHETQFPLRQHCDETIDRLVREGMLIREDNRIRLSSSGLYISDSIVSQFL
jgi:oxygen-independent coproporphyrinogen-3 oxidase